MRVNWPLVGRAAEIHTIRAAVTAPDLSGIVVSGAAGVGKSRLVREALKGANPRWIVGTTAARGLPLGAFAAWAGDPDGDRLQLVRGVIEAITSTPRGAPALLGIDDAQLLDDLSAFVLHQVVQRGAARVILTVREGDPIPDSVREIWKDHPFDRLDVGPLRQQDSAELLAAALDGPVDSDAAHRLWQLTRGNALYLRNIVEQELTDGRLQQRDGSWHWVGLPVLPTNLVELIESRFGDLTPAVGDVVDALAVAEPLELSILQRITSTEAVEEANVRGLIALHDNGDGVEARVSHPLYGEMRRTRTPVATLRRLRGRIATELAAGNRADDMRVAVRRATLSVDSDLTPNPALLVRAAQGATRLADLSLAERLASAAEHAGAGPEATYLRAHALSWLFRGQEAEDVLAGLSTTDLPDTERARFAHLRASNLLWALRRPADAKSHVDEVYAELNADGRQWLDAFLTVYWFAMDQPQEAERCAKLLSLHNLPEFVGSEAAWALATVAADAGRTADALDLTEIGYRTSAHAFDTPHIRFNLADSELTALVLAGRLADAEKVAEQARLEATDLPGVAHSLGPAIAARAALARGRLDTAAELFDQVAVVMASHSTGWGFRYSVARATAAAMRGATEEAAEILDGLDAVERPFRSLDHERSVGRAWVSASQGTVGEAIDILAEAAQKCGEKRQFAAEVFCLQTAAQFGDRTHADRLAELAAIVEGPRAGLAARFAAALRDREAHALSLLSDEYEQMGDPVAAADAAAQAAIIYRHEGRRGSMLTCSTRADDLARECGVVTPATEQAAERIPLTPREREVVALLAAGVSSSRVIAERLNLSVRTVEGHIYRAMAKTGTTTREELAKLFKRRRP